MVFNSYQFTDIAKEDIDSTIKYISETLHNPVAAKDLLYKIVNEINYICIYPESFQIVDNKYIKYKNVRRRIIDNYSLYYIFDKDKEIITFIRFISISRKINSIL